MHSEDESALDHGGTTRERWDAERTTFQRVYDVLVGIREPASVAQFTQWGRLFGNRRALGARATDGDGCRPAP